MKRRHERIKTKHYGEDGSSTSLVFDDENGDGGFGDIEFCSIDQDDGRERSHSFYRIIQSALI